MHTHRPPPWNLTHGRLRSPLSPLTIPPFLPCREAACLLSPLQSLCNYDETQVREAAVSAINTICAEMPSDLLKAEFVPIVQKLAGNSDWWAPRVSACGLVHTAYEAHTLQEDVNGRREMVKMFKVRHTLHLASSSAAPQTAHIWLPS